jgi:alpha-beta hydrolase superfamily lysophospholipase
VQLSGSMRGMDSARRAAWYDCSAMPTMPPKIEFYTAPDGRRLAARVWSAAERPQARVLFLHGITSHGGWYEQSAEFLAAAGFEVVFLDRRGSGLNGESMGDVTTWTTWPDDVAAYPKAEVPTFLCGISWGGKLAAATVRRHPGRFAGVSLVCPGLYSPFMPGIAKRLALAAPVTARMRERRLRIPLRRPELFTDTEAWRSFIARDPLALRTITWRFAQEDRKLTRYAREAAAFLHLPTLLMLTGKDRIVDNRHTREYFARIPAYQKTLIEYAGAAHTLEFEPDPSQYFRDLAGWFERTK